MAHWIKSLFYNSISWWGIWAVYDETCMNCECSAAHARVVAAAHMRTLRNLYVELSCTQLLFTIRFQTCLGNVETTRIRYIGIFYQWNNSGDEISVKNLFLFRQFQPPGQIKRQKTCDVLLIANGSAREDFQNCWRTVLFQGQLRTGHKFELGK